jgi:hypothetical protein
MEYKTISKETANHYQLIRNNPQYRAELRLQELEDRSEPCHYREIQRVSPTMTLNVPENISSKDLQELQAQLNHLTNKLNEHLDYKKREETLKTSGKI